MKAGVWFYGAGTILAGILDIAWGAFDAAHQPISALGKNMPGQQMLAYLVGVVMVAAGIAILWRGSTRFGAVLSGFAYLSFAALWMVRYYSVVHVLGWRIDALAGTAFGIAQQAMLVSPAVLVYASTSGDSALQKRAGIAGRWMLGLPPIIFGILHLMANRVFASIVPNWIPFGVFWAALTGLAFFLAGVAICSGKMDVQAAKLLALMLLLFEGIVEIPPIFVRLHNQATWSAAVYNVAAIGACLIFTEFLAMRADERRMETAEEDVAISGPDRVVA